MPDVRDHRDNAQPRRTNGKLSIPRGTYLRITAPRHGVARVRPSRKCLPVRSAESVARSSIPYGQGTFVFPHPMSTPQLNAQARPR